MLRNSSYFCAGLLTFFIINSSKKFFQDQYVCVKEFGSRSVGTDLDPNCLQRLSTDDKGRL